MINGGDIGLSEQHWVGRGAKSGCTVLYRILSRDQRVSLVETIGINFMIKLAIICRKREIKVHQATGVVNVGM